MKLDNRITLQSVGFNEVINADFPTFFQKIVASFLGTLDQGYFTGYQEDSPEPNHDVGPWLRFGLWWWGWDSRRGINRYIPFPLLTAALNGITLFYTLLQSTTTAVNHITLNMPGGDHSFQTLATLDDIGARTPHNTNESVSASGTDFNINFDAHTRTFLEPSGNFKVNAVGGKDGDKHHLWIKVGAGLTTTPTWPSDWIIGPGSIPPASVSQYQFKHIVIDKVGNKTFVTFKKSFVIGSGGTSASVVAPVIQSIVSIEGSGIVDVTFDKLLKGNLPVASDFAVTRNGLTNEVTSAVVTGKHVYVYVSNAFTTADTGELTYGGATAIKDVDGNSSGVFGPSDIEMRSAGTINRFSGTTGFSGHMPVSPVTVGAI